MTGFPVRTDPQEVLRGLRLILEPGQVTELRAFESKRPLAVGYFTTEHLELMAKAAVGMDRASGVYFLPNVVDPALLSRATNRTRRAGEVEATKDHDVVRRRWLLVDCDPIRPAGISSTDAEHDAALARVREIRAHLAGYGWPEPILADSGNGGHLLYRVDLPSEDGGVVDRCLQALGHRFTGTGVDVDQTVKNPSRIWKLYGTPARKGDSTPERPHRLSRILEAPPELLPVPLALLEGLGATVPAKPQRAVAPARTSTSSPAAAPGGETDWDRTLKRARAHLAKVEPAVAGQGGDKATFRACAILVKDYGLSTDDALTAIQDWNARCSPPWGLEDLRRKLDNAGRYGKPTGPEGFRQMEGRPAPQARRGRPEEPPHPVDLMEPEGAPGPGDHEEASPDLGREPAAAVADGALEPEGVREHLRWRYTSSGPKLERTGGNLAKILRLDSRWGKRLALNEMTQDLLFDGRPIDDTFADVVQEQIEDTYGASFGADEVTRKVRSQATQNSFHPVRQSLLALPPWDEVERLFKVPEDILQVTDDLAGHYFRHWAIAAVRRAFEPGCKFDEALVLVGAQGKGKSTFWEILAGEEFFMDTPIDLDSKDRFQQLGAAWIVELPEIDWQTYAKTAEALKAFLSARTDRFRPPYGKSVMTVRRSSVCVGSTNKDEFLTDPTGSRRFWPVAVPKSADMDLPALRLIRDQLWAEALVLYRAGTPHHLPRELDERRKEQAEQFTVEDTWESLVETALEQIKAERLKNSIPWGDGVTTAEIMLAMHLPPKDHSRPATNRVRDMMRKLGWISKQTQIGGPENRRSRWHPPLSLR